MMEWHNSRNVPKLISRSNGPNKYPREMDENIPTERYIIVKFQSLENKGKLTNL